MAAAPIFLINRDIAIILMVQSFGGCTIEQIAKRLFPSLNSDRSCYRRVAELVGYGYLATRRLPAASGVGSGKQFLSVTPKGRVAVAAALAVPISDLTRFRANAPRFIEHHLAIGNTRIAFEIAAQHSGLFTVLDWSGDRAVQLSAEVGGPKGRETLILKPDSAFTIGLPDGRTQQFFLEQDMATMTARGRMKARLHGYLVAARSRPIPVLFVTTTRERLRARRDLAQETAAQHNLNARTIWLTTTDQLATKDALHSPIWVIPGVEHSMAVSDVTVSAFMDQGTQKNGGHS